MIRSIVKLYALAIVQWGRREVLAAKQKKPTIILETVADLDSLICHAFFRIVEAQNNITIRGHSPLFDALIAGDLT